MKIQIGRRKVSEAVENNTSSKLKQAFNKFYSNFYKNEVSLTDFSGEENMAIQVSFKNESKQLTYSDLPLNSAFRINSDSSRGAIYIKIKVVDHRKKMSNRENTDYMYEIATGKAFPATTNYVEPVTVSVNVDSVRPAIYNS